MDEQWFEFNDMSVTPIVKETALSMGGGGPESIFDVKDGVVTERSRVNNTSAYMLVYIRECDRQEIMREIPVQQIP